MPTALRFTAACVLAAFVAACAEASDGARDPVVLRAPADAVVSVVRAIPHRSDAFTQGLAWDDGELYESTGLVGSSTLARIDPSDGSVEEQIAVDPEVFAEGVAVVGDRLVQLTWKDEIAYVWDRESFELLEIFDYDGEGWGLCHDGSRLVMSDGSPELTFRDPATFEETGSVEVRLGGEPVDELNELECVGDRVYANVWHTNTIMEIDPGDGSVTAVVDASALIDRLDPPPTDAQAVLNGIAHDPETGTFWLTGKLWPQLFEVRFSDGG